MTPRTKMLPIEKIPLTLWRKAEKLGMDKIMLCWLHNRTILAYNGAACFRWRNQTWLPASTPPHRRLDAFRYGRQP
jgi:hypothetical protein